MTNPFADVPLGDDQHFIIERGSIEGGRTLSIEAVDALTASIRKFILTQLALSWDTTTTPPSGVKVTVRCDFG